MAISNKYQIERRYIRKGDARSGAKLVKGKPTFIVSHETANNKADADDHFNYFNNNQPKASAHAFIDDQKILEIIPLDEKAWHVQYQKPMDNKLFGYNANDAAIGVELCRTGDFKKAYDKYVWYHAYLCRKFNLNPNKHIVAHKTLDPQRRSDPHSWLEPNGVTWDEFINNVLNYYINWNADDKVNIIKPKTKIANQSVIPSDNLIRYGDKGPAVKEIQQKLIKAGFPLPRYGADGHFGDETLKAVRAFQGRFSLLVDGIVGSKTKAKLDEVVSQKSSSGSRKAIVPYPGHLIKRGSRGKDVQRIQRAVGVTQDGIFGPKTEAAVKAYQRRHGLKADGIVGPKTWNVIF